MRRYNCFGTPHPHCHHIPEKRKKIILKKEVIMKEVDRISYKLGEVAVDDTIKRDRLQSDTYETLDSALIDTYMDEREALLRRRLAFCLDERNCEPVVCNDIEEPGEYVYDLILDGRFPDGDLKVVCRIMSDYLAKASLLDWYKNSGTNFSQAFAVEVDELEAHIIDILRGPNYIRHMGVPYMPSGRLR